MKNPEIPNKGFESLADPKKLWGLTPEVTLQELQDSPRRMAVDLLRMFLANRTPITLWGPVGSRKTRSIEALARETDEEGIPYQVITIQPSTSDPTILHGMYYTSLQSDGSTVMRRSVPDVANQIVRYWEEYEGLTVIFADEMSTCLPAQQHALLGILTHGKYGDLDISPYITIAMAANPEGTVSTVNPLGEQVINRGGHLAWYGDHQLFLEEWRRGFGVPEREPGPELDWYTTTLLMQAPEAAFRNPDNWTPDSLVPYDLMEHTERAVTEHAKMVKMVNTTFAAAPDSVRHWYLVEVTRALLGPRWADRMATVVMMEGTRITGESVIRQVRELAVHEAWDEPTLVNRLGAVLYTTKAGPIEVHQLAAVAKEITEAGRPLTEAGRWARLAMWALVTTAPDQNHVAALHLHVVELARRSLELVRSGDLNKEEAIPRFVPVQVRERIRAAFYVHPS